MLKILVVCHDAGGANILVSLIKKYRRNFHWIICVSGPAKNIFLRKRIKPYVDSVDFENYNAEDILIKFRPGLLLTGTGWASHFERDFLGIAKKLGIKTVSFLDHWCNYRERFGYPGDWVNNLPDFILVGDKSAYQVALREGFPRRILQQVRNPYFEEIIEESKRIKKSKNKKANKLNILYVSDSIYEHALKYHNDPYFWGYTEYEVLKDLLKIMDLYGSSMNIGLKIRLHPDEKIDKYSRFLKNRKVIITNAKKDSLIKDCLCADIVIGSDTMALVVAIIIGRKTISYIPTNKIKCSLPQKEIKKIKRIDRLIEEIKLCKRNRRSIKHVNNWHNFKDATTVFNKLLKHD